MKVLSLFDGISCGRLALERSGITVDRYVAYEIESNAIKVSKANWDDIEHCGDVTTADFNQYKGFDAIIGGFPCQDLSINKRDRKGLDGKRSGLFWHLVRAIEEVKPRYFLVENNYKMPKKDQDIITQTLGVEPILIYSGKVSAQSRYRLYWTNIPNVQQPKDLHIYLKDIVDHGVTEEKDLASITKFNNKIYNNYDRPARIGTIGKGGQGERVYSIEGKSVTLKANGGGRGAKAGLYLIDDVVRKPTPIECERLQTLPDNYTACLSDNERRKVIGNGWTVDVIAHILSFLPDEYKR